MRLVLAVAVAALIAAPLVQAQTAAAPTPAQGSAMTITEGQAFLDKNKTAPGVVALPSGLQYKVVTSGPKTGPSPKLGDIIKVHYEGKLLDGTVFDSSFERGQAAIMPADGLIPGWLEALPLMHVGDEWTLWIPASLAYGERSTGPIPANSVLVFRLRLIGMLAVD